MSSASEPNANLSDMVSHKQSRLPLSSAKDARAVRTSAALRDAMLSLLETKPFEQITVRDICAQAGVHYATFFRHHETKEALLDYIAAEQIEQLVQLTLPIRMSQGEQNANLALCEYVHEHRRLWTILLNGGAGAAMREEWLRQSLIVAQAHEPANSWLPMELGVLCSISLIADTLSWWLAQESEAERYSVEQVATILHRLMRGVLAGADD